MSDVPGGTGRGADARPSTKAGRSTDARPSTDPQTNPTTKPATGSVEPTATEVRLAPFFTNRLLSPVYRRFVDSLELTGREDVIDFGSGSGAEARHLARRLPDGELTCVDVSAIWLATARRVLRRYQNVRFVLGDIRESDLPKDSFDLVVIHWMFHDISGPDREPILRTLIALLRPGGRIAIREPSAPSSLSDGEWLDPGRLRGLLSGVGLRELRWEQGKLLWARYSEGVFEKPASERDADAPAPAPESGPTAASDT